MIRSVASKVMWVGRAAVFLVGLAVLVGLVVGVVSRATAHTGSAGLFHLNHNNPVSALSTLTGTLTGAVLKVDNNGTGPALSLEANAGKAPVVVNSTAGKATNLNADKVDGQEASSFSTQAGLNNEVATRASADQNLQSSLDQEASARQNADNALSNQLDNHNHDAAYVNETDHTKAAHDALDIDADTVDGKDSSELVGTAGQSAQTSFGTSSVNVSPSTANTLIPGLERTVQVPDGGVLFVSTDGGLQTQSTLTTGFSVSDVALLVDGSLTSNAFFRRIVCANTGGFTQMMCPWNFGGTLQLSPGPHTLRVVASGSGVTSASQAMVSGNNSSALQGQLSVVVLNT